MKNNNTTKKGIAIIAQCVEHQNAIKNLRAAFHNGLIKLDTNQVQALYDELCEEVRHYSDHVDLGLILKEFAQAFPDDADGGAMFRAFGKQLVLELTGEYTSGNKSMVSRKCSENQKSKTQGVGGGRAKKTAKEQADAELERLKKLPKAVRTLVIKQIIAGI